MQYENNTFEGGTMFGGTSDIRGDIAQKIASDIIDMLKPLFPGKRVEPSGSTMKKGANEACGDIDIIIEEPYTPEARKKLTDWASESFPGTQVNEEPGFHIVSFVYPYREDGEEKYAQVDMKLADNFDWSQDFAYSPSSSESKFKAVAKNLLLTTIASHSRFKGEDPEGKYADEFFTDDDYAGTKNAGLYTGQLKNKWRYSMDAIDGLSLAHKTARGKTKMLSRYETIKNPDGTPDKVGITKNYLEAIKLVLGPEATLSDVRSVESILNYIFSGKFETTPEDLEEIKERFIHHLLRQKRVNPKSEAEERLNQRFDKMIEDFNQLWNEHQGSSSLNESRCSRFGMKVNDLVRRMNLL